MLSALPSTLPLLSSLSPTSLPAYFPLPSVIRLYISTLLYASYIIAFRPPSLEDKGPLRTSAVGLVISSLGPLPFLQIGAVFAMYHRNIQFHLPVCVGGPACITGTPINYSPTLNIYIYIYINKIILY